MDPEHSHPLPPVITPADVENLSREEVLQEEGALIEAWLERTMGEIFKTSNCLGLGLVHAHETHAALKSSRLDRHNLSEKGFQPHQIDILYRTLYAHSAGYYLALKGGCGFQIDAEVSERMSAILKLLSAYLQKQGVEPLVPFEHRCSDQVDQFRVEQETSRVLDNATRELEASSQLKVQHLQMHRKLLASREKRKALEEELSTAVALIEKRNQERKQLDEALDNLRKEMHKFKDAKKCLLVGLEYSERSLPVSTEGSAKLNDALDNLRKEMHQMNDTNTFLAEELDKTKRSLAATTAESAKLNGTNRRSLDELEKSKLSLADAVEQRAKLTEANRRLQDELDQTKRSLLEGSAEITKLNEANRRLIDELDKTKQSLAEAIEESGRIKKIAISRNAAIPDFSTTLVSPSPQIAGWLRDGAERRLSRAIEDNDKIKAELARLMARETDHQELEEKCKGMKTLLDLKDEDNLELRKELDNRNSQYKFLVEQCEALAKKYESLRLHPDAKDADIDMLRKEVEAVSKQRLEREKINSSREAEIDRLGAALEEAKIKIALLSLDAEHLTSLEKTCAELEALLKMKDAEIVLLKQACKEQKTREAQLKTLQDQNDAAKQLDHCKEAEIRKLRRELEEMRWKCRGKSENVIRLDAEAQRNEQRLRDLQHQVDVTQKSLVASEFRVAKLQVSFQELEAAKAKVETSPAGPTAKEIQDELNQTHQRYVKLQTDYSNLEGELNSLKAINAMLVAEQIELHRKSDDSTRLWGEINALRLELARLQAEVDNGKKELSKEMIKTEASENELTKTKEELLNALREITRLQSDLSKSGVGLAASEKELSKTMIQISIMESKINALKQALKDARIEETNKINELIRKCTEAMKKTIMDINSIHGVLMLTEVETAPGGQNNGVQGLTQAVTRAEKTTQIVLCKGVTFDTRSGAHEKAFGTLEIKNFADERMETGTYKGDVIVDRQSDANEKGSRIIKKTKITEKMETVTDQEGITVDAISDAHEKAFQKLAKEKTAEKKMETDTGQRCAKVDAGSGANEKTFQNLERKASEKKLQTGTGQECVTVDAGSDANEKAFGNLEKTMIAEKNLETVTHHSAVGSDTNEVVFGSLEKVREWAVSLDEEEPLETDETCSDTENDYRLFYEVRWETESRAKKVKDEALKATNALRSEIDAQASRIRDLLKEKIFWDELVVLYASNLAALIDLLWKVWNKALLTAMTVYNVSQRNNQHAEKLWRSLSADFVCQNEPSFQFTEVLKGQEEVTAMAKLEIDADMDLTLQMDQLMDKISARFLERLPKGLVFKYRELASDLKFHVRGATHSGAIYPERVLQHVLNPTEMHDLLTAQKKIAIWHSGFEMEIQHLKAQLQAEEAGKKWRDKYTKDIVQKYLCLKMKLGKLGEIQYISRPVQTSFTDMWSLYYETNSLGQPEIPDHFASYWTNLLQRSRWVEPLSERTARQTITAIYAAKIKNDYASMRSNKAPHEMPEYLYLYFQDQFGRSTRGEEKLMEFMSTIMNNKKQREVYKFGLIAGIIPDVDSGISAPVLPPQEERIPTSHLVWQLPTNINIPRLPLGQAQLTQEFCTSVEDVWRQVPLPTCPSFLGPRQYTCGFQRPIYQEEIDGIQSREEASPGVTQVRGAPVSYACSPRICNPRISTPRTRGSGVTLAPLLETAVGSPRWRAKQAMMPFVKMDPDCLPRTPPNNEESKGRRLHFTFRRLLHTFDTKLLGMTNEELRHPLAENLVEWKNLFGSTFSLEELLHPLTEEATERVFHNPGVQELLGQLSTQRFLDTVGNVDLGVPIYGKQLPQLHALLYQACEAIDVEVPYMYVRDSPYCRAYLWCPKYKRPSIIFNSALFDILSPFELQVVMAQQLAAFKYPKYRLLAMAWAVLILAPTILEQTQAFEGCDVLPEINVGNIKNIYNLRVIEPKKDRVVTKGQWPICSTVVNNLDRWIRFLDLVGDRAAFVISRSVSTVVSANMKMASGSHTLARQLNVKALIEQGHQVDAAVHAKQLHDAFQLGVGFGKPVNLQSQSGAVPAIVKDDPRAGYMERKLGKLGVELRSLDLLKVSHSLVVLRARELQRWAKEMSIREGKPLEF